MGASKKVTLRYALRNGIVCETETTECKYNNKFYPNGVHVVYVPEGLKNPAGVRVVAGDRITLMFQPEKPPVGGAFDYGFDVVDVTVDETHEKEYHG